MKGLDKAALLLLAVGEDLAGEVLKHLKQQEIQKVTAAMVHMETVKSEEVLAVTQEFLKTLEENEVVGLDGGQYMQNILEKTIGLEKASKLMENFFLHGGEQGIEAIRVMEPRIIADYVKREHPQVIAFVLASIDPPKASKVLELLPDYLQGEVVYRIATMQDIHPSVLGELEHAVKDHVAESSTGPGFNLGGVKYAADVLNSLETSIERKILEEIRDIEEPIWAKIEEQLFVFEEIQELDDKTLQLVLREVSSDLLAKALRGSDDAMKEKFFRNMSERAAGILKEEMEMMGPVRLKDVEKAQQEVVKIVKRLEEEGKIVLGGKGGEEVFV